MVVLVIFLDTLNVPTPPPSADKLWNLDSPNLPVVKLTPSVDVIDLYLYEVIKEVVLNKSLSKFNIDELAVEEPILKRVKEGVDKRI